MRTSRSLLFRVGDAPPPLGCGVYVGFDPTADSLHLGNLLSIIALLHFQRNGYQPIAVVSHYVALLARYALVSAHYLIHREKRGSHLNCSDIPKDFSEY